MPDARACGSFMRPGIDIEVFQPPVLSGENASPEIWGVRADAKEDAPIGPFDGPVLV